MARDREARVAPTVETRRRPLSTLAGRRAAAPRSHTRGRPFNRLADSFACLELMRLMLYTIYTNLADAM